MENDATLQQSSAELNKRADFLREITGRCLDEGIKESDLTVISLFLADAIVDEDGDSLDVILNFAQSAQSPALGLSSVDMAKALSLGEVSYHASIRLLPVISDTELTYLQMADGHAYKKEQDSVFTKEEWRLIDLGYMVCRGLQMELTPKGELALERSRTQIEKHD